MGQGASSEQKPQQVSASAHHAATTKTPSSAKDSPRNDASTSSSSRLRYSRSIRDVGRNVSSASQANAASGSTSSGKPRRKSLDMPDMSLSMTGTGTVTATPSAASTPMLPSHTSSERTSPLANKLYNGLSAAQRSTVLSPNESQQVNDNEDGQLGLPMAAGPVENSSSSAQYKLETASGLTSSTAKVASWARRKEKGPEGLIKKAQPVTGSAAALHAIGQSASTTPFSSSSAATSRQNLSPHSAHTAQPRNSTDGEISNDFPPSAPGSLVNSDDLTLQGITSPHATVGTHGTDPHELSSPTSSNITISSIPPWQPFPNAVESEGSAHQQGISDGGNIESVDRAVAIPLKQPTETILAPELPPEVNIIIPPLINADAAHDIIEPATALAIGIHETLAAVASANGRDGKLTTSSGVVSPVLASSHSTADDSAMLVHSVIAGSAHASGTTTPTGFASPLLPGSTPPIGNPPNTLPAAAPIAALNPNLSQDPKAQEAVQAATVDLGAGPDGVPTLLTWKSEEEAGADPSKPSDGPHQVFVTGTFAKGWNTKIELRQKAATADNPKQNPDFTALVKLPPGPHSLKFIVDKQWKTSKYLPSATDADGNLINYLQVHKADQNARYPSVGADAAYGDVYDYESEEDDDVWTSDIPPVLVTYGDATEAALDAQEEAERLAAEKQATTSGARSAPPPLLPQLSSNWSPSPPLAESGSIPTNLPHPAIHALSRKPLSQLQTAQPPIMPAQLERGVLNMAVLVAKGSGDDNSILPKPDHSVLNHLAASPIKGGLLSVGVTTRYRRKYVTTVYYKKPTLE